MSKSIEIPRQHKTLRRNLEGFFIASVLSRYMTDLKNACICKRLTFHFPIALAQPKPNRLRLDRMARRDRDPQWNPLAVAVGRWHALFVDMTLDGHHAFYEHLWAWRATGDIDIDGDELVHALDGGVGVEHAAGGCTGTHGDHPFGFGHLFVDSLEDGEHLSGDAPGDNHQVRLARREPHDFCAESGEVIAG